MAQRRGGRELAQGEGGREGVSRWEEGSQDKGEGVSRRGGKGVMKGRESDGEGGSG